MSFAELCPDCTPPDVGTANVQIAAGEFDGDPTDDLLLTFNTSMHVGLNALAETATWVAFPHPGQISSTCAFSTSTKTGPTMFSTPSALA